MIELLKQEPRGRAFLLAHAQSALGTGAGAAALVVVAYTRFHSPWAIASVLLADFLPGMLVGPLCGAAADRWSRQRCMVAADIIRTAAFVGLGLVDGIAATIALALLAGLGSALYSPASLSALPGLVERDRLSAATSLFGGLKDLGRTLGPLLAALAFPLIGASNVLIVNGATFAISALLLARVRVGPPVRPGAASRSTGLLREALDGVMGAARMEGVRVVLVSSSAVILFAGVLNVAELLLAHELGSGASGFSVLLSAYGVGVVAGSMRAARGCSLGEQKSRYLGGIVVVGLGLTMLSLAPLYAVALPAMLIMGIGNGVVVVQERLLLQRTVADQLMGRTFAALDTLGAWAFAAAFVSAGALISLVGTRTLLAIAGICTLLVWVAARAALRHTWTGADERSERLPPAGLAAESRL